MNHTILYIGLDVDVDVDDTQYHGSALSKHIGTDRWRHRPGAAECHVDPAG